jgi:hypothetical protein
MRITSCLFLVAALPVLAGCSVLEGLRPGSAGSAPTVASPPSSAPGARPVLGRGKSAASLDRTSDADKAAALKAPAKGRELGRAVVSLGSPSEPGLWLRSALVKTAGPGHIRTASGQSLAVDLTPGQGGAILSFGAFRALNLPLTSLPEVTVLSE